MEFPRRSEMGGFADASIAPIPVIVVFRVRNSLVILRVTISPVTSSLEPAQLFPWQGTSVSSLHTGGKMFATL